MPDAVTNYNFKPTFGPVILVVRRIVDMRYSDPLQVTCARCLAKAAQHVTDLLCLRATCPICGTALAEIGLEMRADHDDWCDFLARAEIASHLEESIGTSIDDAELEGAITLRDIAYAIERHLPNSPDRQNRAIEVVRSIAIEISGGDHSDVALDTPILDAIDPARWDSL